MKITYLGHSGFLMEWETCYWLFDYYKGDIPELDAGKKLFVFVSHKHQDHFNPEIFNLYKKYVNTEYVLSSDINVQRLKFAQMGISDTISSHIVSVRPLADYELYDNNNQKILLKTLKSTDCGVAFLLFYQEKTIYHAGDLNLWVWKEGSKQFNNNMTAEFNREMEYLKDVPIDVAFAPLDPRQEEEYYRGLEQLLNTAKVKYIFPMHFWDMPSIIQKFKMERAESFNKTLIMDIYHSGQNWNLNL